jgi:hypothetical protein
MPRTSAPPPTLLEFLKPYDNSVQQLALRLRTVVLRTLGPCHESIYDAYNAVALGYGPTDRFKDFICHIAVYTKHVNLGFNRGASLPDPRGVLTGSGKSIRHITIETPADLERPEIEEFLKAAQKQAGQSGAPVTDRTRVTSSVKGRSPTRRRPRKSKG